MVQAAQEPCGPSHEELCTAHLPPRWGFAVGTMTDLQHGVRGQAGVHGQQVGQRDAEHAARGEWVAPEG